MLPKGWKWSPRNGVSSWYICACAPETYDYPIKRYTMKK